MGNALEVFGEGIFVFTRAVGRSHADMTLAAAAKEETRWRENEEKVRAAARNISGR